jgi:hypothetical protein
MAAQTLSAGASMITSLWMVAMGAFNQVKAGPDDGGG